MRGMRSFGGDNILGWPATAASPRRLLRYSLARKMGWSLTPFVGDNWHLRGGMEAGRQIVPHERDWHFGRPLVRFEKEWDMAFSFNGERGVPLCSQRIVREARISP